MATSNSPEEYQKELDALRDEIERKTGKTTEQLYEEREKRVRDVIGLKVPDRVPFAINLNTSRYCGIPNSAAYYDPIGWKRAMRKITLDFEPDMCNAGLPTSGTALEILDVKNRLWPGGPLPPDYEYQFLEGMFMKEDEYDIFLNDPSDFVVRYFLPRMYGALAPLADLPPLGSIFQGFEGIVPLFNRPEFIKMARSVAKAGEEMTKFRETIGDSYEELARLGFPPFAHIGAGGVGGAPYDTVSSFLRGMQGAMTDMFRQPEKLLKLCDMILGQRIERAIAADSGERGNPKRIGMPLWRGDKAFMSEAQFKKFYWPGLKRALQATIDLGNVPVPFFEAEFGDRLACLLELPKGKVIASIEYMDVDAAIEILGDHTCMYTRIPLTSKVWSLREVERYTKELIDKFRGRASLLLNIRLPDNGTREEMIAVIDSIKQYGRY
jgi:hypothetical protein